VTFALASGQVCLAEWSEPLTVEHVVNLLVDLREARQALRGPPLLVLAIRAVVFAGDGPFEIIPTALPALLDSSSGLFVVLDALSRAQAVRALFTATGCRTARSALQIFASLDDALVAAQKVAPHDALELQRQTLRRRP
jgi:hypothetical protein